MDVVQITRHLDIQSRETEQPATLHVDKWVVLRELGVSRRRFGITDRHLVVLQALLALRKGAELRLDDPTGLIVHPSNATLSARLNGMPFSTLRRHLARLVDAGLIARRDSPNGKRYVRRYRDGDRDVFGFDLTPLVYRSSEFITVANEVRNEEEKIARLRRTVSLMRRDLAGLADIGRTAETGSASQPEIDDLLANSQRILRRKLDTLELEALQGALAEAITFMKEACRSSITSASARQFERHYQTSDLEIPVFKMSNENFGEPTGPLCGEVFIPKIAASTGSDLSLVDIKSACPEIVDYSPNGIESWRCLFNTASLVSPMMGISRSAWDDAVKIMGAIVASTVVAGILQRFSHIKSPGGYLRSLTAKAANGAFSCRPMISALLRSIPHIHSCEYLQTSQL